MRSPRAQQAPTSTCARGVYMQFAARLPLHPLTPQLHQPAAVEHEASLLLRRRSLNVISGEAYTRWHGISESVADHIDERVANVAAAGAAIGDVVTREDRVSIVFVRKLDG